MTTKYKIIYQLKKSGLNFKELQNFDEKFCVCLLEMDCDTLTWYEVSMIYKIVIEEHNLKFLIKSKDYRSDNVIGNYIILLICNPIIA